MSWSDRAYKVMCEVRIAGLQACMTPPELVAAIDAAYPFGERTGWPYKAWLNARRDFCARHGLPLKKPHKANGDLFAEPETSERPLFIPLMRQHFERFLNGTKREEFRPEGPRWNARTCRIGRPVVLSLGYGKASRLTGVIVSYRASAEPTQSEEWASCYPGRTSGLAACIGIEVMEHHQDGQKSGMEKLGGHAHDDP